MRKQLNENPVVQAALVGVLAIAMAFILLTRVMGGGDAEPAPDPAAVEGTTAGVPAEELGGEISSAAGSEAVAPPAEAMEAGEAAAAAEAVVGAALSANFKAGPGLPKGVVNAYEDGRAVAILITRKAGIEDGRLRAMLARIRSAGDVAVFHAYARDIARFSRVTGGVDVNRVPALVVIRPRELSDSDVPLASVSYGFRGPASAEQAVRDALYKGPQNLPYHPR